MTLLEVGVVVAILAILALVFFQRYQFDKHPKLLAQEITCINNQKMINTAFKVWSGDSMVRFPMGVSVTNGGSMEMVQTGEVVHTFLAMSNELGGTSKLLLCPADAGRFWTNGFLASGISYFVGADVTNDDNPQTVLIGDCNFEIDGTPVNSGLHPFWSNDPVQWQATRHIKSGNLGFADGSVQSSTSSNLQTYLQQTGFVTNHFAIP